MIILIANPASRSGRGKRLWPGWLAALEKSRTSFRLLQSASREDCEATARAAASHDAVIAVGGDGTINAVISGLLGASDPRNGPTAARLGVLYAGTSPDFCRFHGISTEPDDAMEVLLAGGTRDIDIISFSYRSRSGEGRQGFFASSCNIGLGAATAAFANSYRRYLGDIPGTGLGLIRAMLSRRSFNCRLALDGGPALEFPHANHVMLIKNPFIASGLRLNLPLLPDDGLMYAVVIHGHSPLRLLSLMRSLYAGDWADAPGVFARSCRGATVMTDPPQEVECDGDPRGEGPVHAALLPRVLSLVCAQKQGENHE